MTRPIVVLVGAPGSGKTTVGKILAERLGVRFRDTDADVEETAGKVVSDIFIDDGEERFRELEQEAVRRALAEHGGVLVLGGGAVLEPGTRGSLREHRTVFLDVGLADAVKRVGLARDRPLLISNPRANLRKALDDRRQLYEEVASLTVSTDGREPGDIADEIGKALETMAGMEGS